MCGTGPPLVQRLFVGVDVLREPRTAGDIRAGFPSLDVPAVNYADLTFRLRI